MATSKWDEIGSDDQDALIEWYNIAETSLDDTDRERLAELFQAGKFRHWTCRACDETIMVGEPDNWDHFQGALQSEYWGDLCADCAGHYLKLKDWAGE